MEQIEKIRNGLDGVIKAYASLCKMKGCECFLDPEALTKYNLAKQALQDLDELEERLESEIMFAELSGFINGIQVITNKRPKSSYTHDGANTLNELRLLGDKRVKEAQAAIKVIRGSDE